MTRAFLLMVWMLCPIYAQTGVTPVFNMFPTQLQTYLELTSDQVTKITQANTTLDQYLQQKSQRSAQAYLEISQEISKASPDPMTIGLRYVELETINRDMASERKKTVAAVQLLLTPAQKTKLTALQQAMALSSTGCLAISENLLESPVVAVSVSPFPGNIIPANRIAPRPGSVATISAGFYAPGCAVSVPTSVVRTGDFSGTP